MDSNLLEKVLWLILQDAKRRRDDAGHSGSWTDDGASDLENQIKFYKAGQAGTFPDEWKEYLDKANKLLRIENARKDPAYKDYARIKNLIESE